MADEATPPTEPPDAEEATGDHHVPPDLLDLHVALEAQQAGLL